MDAVSINNFILLHCFLKAIDSMLPYIWSVIDHREGQNAEITSVTRVTAPRVSLLILNTF